MVLPYFVVYLELHEEDQIFLYTIQKKNTYRKG
jgi:hypothetical protein